MRSFYIIVTAWLAFLPLKCMAQSIVAIVNKDAITDLDLTKRMDLIIKTNKIEVNNDSFNAIKWQVTQMLIDEKLCEQDAKKASLSVDDIDVVNAFNAIASGNNMRPLQMENYIKSIGLSKDELNNQIYHRLLWTKIIKTQIEPTVSVTEQDLKLLKVNAIPADRTNDRVKLAEITVVTNKSNVDKAMSLLNELINQVNRGVDFTKLSMEFSQTNNAKYDGSLGWFYISQLSDDVANQVLNLKPGGITQPIISGSSVTIYKVLEREDDMGQKIDLNEDGIRESVFQKKLDIQIKYYINKLRQQAYINILKS